MYNLINNLKFGPSSKERYTLEAKKHQRRKANHGLQEAFM